MQKLYKSDKTTDEEKPILFDGMSGTISSSDWNVVLQGYVLYDYLKNNSFIYMHNLKCLNNINIFLFFFQSFDVAFTWIT